MNTLIPVVNTLTPLAINIYAIDPTGMIIVLGVVILVGLWIYN